MNGIDRLSEPGSMKAAELARWKQDAREELDTLTEIPRIYDIQLDDMRPARYSDLALLGKQSFQFGALYRLLRFVAEKKWDQFFELERQARGEVK